ncbi:MAG: c-type cytochrome [Phycisphaerales bacterium]|nr:c-type cytochrome [Phycisphaerales bacterium]
MMHETTQRNTLHAVGILALLTAVLVAPMTGCRGDRTDKPPHQFFPDMDDQPKLKPQSGSNFYADGQSQRSRVPGTVPFGDNTYSSDDAPAWAEGLIQNQNDALKGDESYYFGLVAGTDDQYVQRMPMKVTQDVLLRGQERFDIFCAMCHGYDAKGGQSGEVGRLFAVPPSNLLDPKYLDRTGELGSDGYLFHVMRDGLWTPTGDLRMPSYSHAIDEKDAWSIVSYIRALQTAQDVDVNTLDSADRAKIGVTDSPNAGGEG